MIVTIDGPAGAGKSSVARRVAERLGFRFLDTGAMYRAVTLIAMRRTIGWDDVPALTRLAATLELRLDDDQVWADGQDVTEAIRTTEVTTSIRHVADQADVRAELVRRQREIVGDQDYVTEGRDQGTVAFPDSSCKIFLTASPETRADRRFAQLSAAGTQADRDEILAQQQRRDDSDSRRPVGRLVRADDAVEVETDGLTLDEVVERLVAIVRRVQHQAASRESERRS